MASVQDRIKSLGGYFGGMQVEEVNGTNVIYVIVNLPPKWTIDKDTEEKYGVTVAKVGESQYYFVAEMELGFDKLFDSISFSISKMLEIEERNAIFKEKMLLLQEIFADESISTDVLRTVDFTYKGKKKAQTKQKQKSVKPDAEGTVEKPIEVDENTVTEENGGQDNV